MKKILSLIFCILVAVLFANVFAAADGNEDIIAVSNEYFLKQTGLTEDDFKWFEVSIAEKQNGYSVQYSFCHTVEDPKYLSILKQVSIVWPFSVFIENGNVNTELSDRDPYGLRANSIKQEQTFLKLIKERETLS